MELPKPKYIYANIKIPMVLEKLNPPTYIPLEKYSQITYEECNVDPESQYIKEKGQVKESMDDFLQRLSYHDTKDNPIQVVLPLLQKELKQRSKSRATTFKSREKPKNAIRTTFKNHSYYHDHQHSATESTEPLS